MRLGSLCTGIGGLDLAVEAVTGAELAWYAEPAEAPWWVMQQHFPGVPNHGSIVEFDWDRVEPVDILTAGYPCQPFSHAGKRQGADDERHLWPYVYDAIHDLRPRLVVLENVAGHLSLGFDEVLGDLAQAGFNAEWCVLRASDVGAPHQRARLFIVATDADSARREGSLAAVSSGRQEPPGCAAADAEGHEQREPIIRVGERAEPRRSHPPAPDTSGVGHERAGRARGRGAGPADGGDSAANADQLAARRDSGTAPRPEGTDAGRCEANLGDGSTDGPRVPWGDFAPAIERWERDLGRPAPRPVDDERRLSQRFVEWMMGYPEGWVDGLTRTQALKALGNAVVPQQGAAAVRLLLDAFSEERAA